MNVRRQTERGIRYFTFKEQILLNKAERKEKEGRRKEALQAKKGDILSISH